MWCKLCASVGAPFMATRKECARMVVATGVVVMMIEKERREEEEGRGTEDV